MTHPDFLQVISAVFFLCIGVLFYAYIGYGILVYCLVKLRVNTPEKISFSGQLPSVSLIIAAYNEAVCIEAKLLNSLVIDYPRDKLEIIFVTDGSTDGTDSIVRNYPEIRLLHHPERKGKTNALNRAVKCTSADILVFSDANAMLNPSCIKEIVKHYAYPAIGGVSGEKKVAASGDSTLHSEEGLYWKYESFLKKTDSAWKTTVGAAGELFSIRHSLYSPLPDDTILDDFVQSLKVCLNGYTVMYEPAAYATELPSLNIRDEFNRKARISAGGFQAMRRLSSLFNIFRSPALSFLFISHRVLRWTACPVALIILFTTNIILALYAQDQVYTVMMILQSIFYLLALVGMVVHPRRHVLLYMPFYFTMMHVAALAGFIIFLRKKQTVLWEKAGRTGMA